MNVTDNDGLDDQVMRDVLALAERLVSTQDEFSNTMGQLIEQLIIKLRIERAHLRHVQMLAGETAANARRYRFLRDDTEALHQVVADLIDDAEDVPEPEQIAAWIDDKIDQEIAWRGRHGTV